ncbi:DUF397 domain-containing protein [Actinomadura rubrisoli]|uniref:DUF397 domain-containing protein n=1 Tax=Actinomadura rubrisoli TaxID=2530368 RepID=A0A4R4ZZI0_9ACTN|nr:DUF397 domain-containing protein [Actinomadura rubrisoli]TDD63569.1 DUF397 domain-containing protein [Actinomadura rubrisoli]
MTTWRKSSHSGTQQGDCVEVANLSSWRKSSHSGTNEQSVCVEVADLSLGVGIRDSKDPGHGPLTLTSEAFADLLAQVKRDELRPH